MAKIFVPGGIPAHRESTKPGNRTFVRPIGRPSADLHDAVKPTGENKTKGEK